VHDRSTLLALDPLLLAWRIFRGLFLDFPRFPILNDQQSQRTGFYVMGEIISLEMNQTRSQTL
jgi:hypothetical protein